MPNDQTVHVIDDDDAARDSLAFLLRTADLDVRTYSSAPEFLAAATSGMKGGCVVTDVRIPQMTVSNCCAACARSTLRSP
jgi:two-component system response regulator FixJ